MRARSRSAQTPRSLATRLWTRVCTGRSEYGRRSIESEYTAFQFGYDRQIQPGLRAGGALSYRDGSNDIASGKGDSSIAASASYTVKLDAAESFIGRAGFMTGMDLPNDRGNVYVRASVLHDWKGDADYTYAWKGESRSLTEELGGTWYEYGLGANFNASKNLHFYADVEAADGGEVDTDYRVNLGARWSF